MAELGDFLVSSEDALKNIEADHLDFAYVESCEDVEMMRGIVTVLRSGKEGHFPELLEKAEAKLLTLLPAAERERTLRLRQAATVKDISIAEEEILQWEKQIALTDENLRNQEALRKMAIDDEVNDISSEPVKDSVVERKVYPVRGTAPLPKPPPAKKDDLLNEVDTSKRRPDENEETRRARIARRQRREMEYKRLVNNRKSVTTGKVNKQSTNENTSVTYITESSIFSDYDALEALPDLERRYKGEREKTKGNEHFKAGEHVDAFLCYTRSVIFDDTNPAAYSNRAIVNLKLNKLELAESDCNSALTLEGHVVSYEAEPAQKKKDKATPILPKSAIKMVSRRGMARFRLGKYKDAIEDFNVAYLATAAAAGSGDTTSTAELEQLLKKAHEKYLEVEGRPYVLIRDRAKLSATQAKAASHADAVAAKVDVPVNRMAPSSSFLFTFNGEDKDCRKPPPKVERGFAGALESKPKAPKVYEWVVAKEGTLSPTSVTSSSSGLGSPGGHFTRISISMSDSESDDEEVGGKEVPSGGFSRITITESDTEEEEEVSGVSVGTRIVIQEDSESEEESVPAPAPVPPSDAEFLAFKEEGNRYMKAKKYQEAIEAYSRCIHTDPAKQAWNNHPSFVAALNNRAAVYLELKDFRQCYDDCGRVLKHEPSNVKAFYRRAAAYEKNSQLSTVGVEERVQLLELALKDAASVLSIERTNKQATVLHQRLVGLVADARSVRDAQAAAACRDKEREREQEEAVRENVTETSAGPVGDAAEWVYEVEMQKQKVKSLLSSGGGNLSGSARTKNLEEASMILQGCLETMRSNVKMASPPSFILELELSLCHLLITTLRSLGGHEDDIVVTSTRAIELDPRNVKAYLHRAQAYVALDKKTQANIDLKRILKLDPYNNEVLGLLDQLSGDTDASAFSDGASAPPGATPASSTHAPAAASSPPKKTPVSSPSKPAETTPVPVFSPPVTTTPMTPVREPVSPAPAVTPASGAAAASLLSPGTPGVSSSSECLRLKELGNKATADKKYEEAIRLYTESITADRTHLASWSNRSQAYLKLSLWDNVIDDCTFVMEHLPKDKQNRTASENSLMIKVCYRRAIAYKGKYVPKMVYTAQFLSKAMEDVCKLLELDSNNKPALQEKDCLTALIASNEEIARKNHPSYAKEKVKEEIAVSGVEGLSARATTVRKSPAPSAPATPMADSNPSSSATPVASASSTKKKKKDKEISNAEAALRAAANITSDIKISSVPTEPPVTVVEFERHWKLLRSKPELFIHQYMLKLFKKSTYKKVIKTSISDELLSYVFKNTYEQCILLVPENDTVELSGAAYSILKGMTANTDNFAMIVSVLSSEDIEYVSNIIGELEGYVSRGADVAYTASNIQSLKNAYNLK